VLAAAASVHDNAGGRALIGALAARHPVVTRAWVDSGYKRAVADAGAGHGIDVQVYAKQSGLEGSAPHPGGR